ncbi:hypothetical protein HPB51_020668 [Rhipicephalus microplus]|uniref:Uncharacterized protein n=1 Tax=Rhipicephalus microplus TaxID=6941 RepID=A0A9J6D710_RHIMP|nr:hypothetical protein HPB51_020668 [Rhipicephalus microplus]
MASVSASASADEKHSLPSRSTDHMMDTQTSQNADPQASDEHNVHPWITITKRANKRRQLQPHTVPTQQLSSMPSEPALCQSQPKTRLPRLPPLPAEDYKLAISPYGGLNLSKGSPETFLLSVTHAANIRSEKPDIKLRVDENQNGVPPIPNPTASSWESTMLSLRRQEQQKLVQWARRVAQGNGALD